MRAETRERPNIMRDGSTACLASLVVVALAEEVMVAKEVGAMKVTGAIEATSMARVVVVSMDPTITGTQVARTEVVIAVIPGSSIEATLVMANTVLQTHRLAATVRMKMTGNPPIATIIAARLATQETVTRASTQITLIAMTGR